MSVKYYSEHLKKKTVKLTYHQFEAADYIFLTCWHHTVYGNVHLCAEFYKDIFHRYRVINVQCENICDPSINKFCAEGSILQSLDSAILENKCGFSFFLLPYLSGWGFHECL